MAVEARVLVPAGLPELAAEAELKVLVAGFPSEEGCRAFLERVRWPDGVRCPRCEASRGISRLGSRGQFDCDACGYQFSVLAGTALHATHLPLSKWFLAIAVLTASSDRLSADRLARTIGVSYKTAWHLRRVIRAFQATGREDAFARTVRRLVGAEAPLVAVG